MRKTTKYSILLAILFCFSSCSKQSAQQGASSNASVPADKFKDNVSLVSQVSPVTAGEATNFYWYNSEGKKISLTDLRGKIVLINFWATWCGPCKAELPDIENLSRSYSSKGLVVIGISVDKGDNLLSDVSDFASQNGLTYQIVVDNDNIAEAYGNINAIPTSFLVNRNGKIVNKWVGIRNKSFLESTINKYLD